MIPDNPQPATPEAAASTIVSADRTLATLRERITKLEAEQAALSGAPGFASAFIAQSLTDARRDEATLVEAKIKIGNALVQATSLPIAREMIARMGMIRAAAEFGGWLVENVNRIERGMRLLGEIAPRLAEWNAAVDGLGQQPATPPTPAQQPSDNVVPLEPAADASAQTARRARRQTDPNLTGNGD